MHIRVLTIALTLGFFSVAPEHHAAPRHEEHRRAEHRHILHSGSTIERTHGRISAFHDEGRHIDVHRNFSGGKRVIVERADHSRLVTEYGRGAYVEHPYTWHGRTLYRRTYYRFGHPVYSRYHFEYRWHGYGYHVWRPQFYWHHPFYVWLHRPWRHNRYRWAWAGQPWTRQYGFYYQPDDYYDDPTDWLSDFALAADLADDYTALYIQGKDHAPEPIAPESSAGPLVTPADKKALADEILYEIDQEQKEADQNAQPGDTDSTSNDPIGIAAVFSDSHPHIFLVSKPVDADDDDTGNECGLTNGDLIRTNDAPDEGDTTASMTVVRSKAHGRECATGAVVNVDLDDLQEMQNDLRQRIHDGMWALQHEQGTGLPTPPPDANGTVPAGYEQAAPPPDNSSGPEIGLVNQQADQAEREVITEDEQQYKAPPDQQPPAPIERK